jgi:hypothetical protein
VVHSAFASPLVGKATSTAPQEDAPDAISEEELPVTAGFLWKKGTGMFSAAKKMYFTVQLGASVAEKDAFCLLCYKDERAALAGDAPTEQAPLANALVLGEAAPGKFKKGKGGFEFSLNTRDGRAWALAAEEDAERQQWAAAIRFVAHALRPRRPRKVSSLERAEALEEEARALKDTSQVRDPPSQHTPLTGCHFHLAQPHTNRLPWPSPGPLRTITPWAAVCTLPWRASGRSSSSSSRTWGGT